LTRTWTALVLFGASFGYVEAAVVVYLRGLYEPLHQRLHSGRAAGELFPLLRPDQLESAGPDYVRWLTTELVREAATLVMLGAVAWAVAGNFRQGFAAFAVAFGIWDLFYYLSLKVLLGWPGSVLTWDLLFLLPVPWAGPVLAPVLVSLSLIGAGTTVLWRESVRRPLPLGRSHWTAISAGGLMLVAAFCWDAPNLLAGGDPNPFNWPLFVLGAGLGLGGFLHALCTRPTAPGEPDH
jgi:hypothetical protein